MKTICYHVAIMAICHDSSLQQCATKTPSAGIAFRGTPLVNPALIFQIKYVLY